jgi:hypothetical protein
MLVSEKINSSWTYIQKSEAVAATVKVASVALYVLKASQTPLAATVTQVESLGKMVAHSIKIFHTNSNQEAFFHLGSAGMHAVIILSQLFEHQIVILLFEIKEISLLTLELGRNFGSWSMFSTLGQIGITGFSIYVRFVPTPETIVISVVLHIASEIGKSFNALYNCQWLDGIGFIAAAGVRGYTNKHHFEYIQHKWTVLNQSDFQKVWARIQQGRDTEFLKDHPMEHLREAIEKDSEIYSVNDQGDLMNLGANFSNLGGSLVKDMRLTGRIRKLKDHELIELRFKLTRIAREKFDEILAEYKTYDPHKLNEFLQFAGVNQKLSISQKPYTLYTNEKGIDKPHLYSYQTHALELEGLGTVQAGAASKVNGLYKNVSASIDGNSTAQDMHMLLSLAGMGQAMVPSTTSEILRWKMGMLFRTFYPSEAIAFQRTPDFFSTTLEEFQETIQTKVPKMKAIYEERLPLMSQQEIRPGWLEWTIPGLSHEVAQSGGSFLVHQVNGDYNFPTTNRLVNMLKMGLLSTTSRFEGGQFIEGMSSDADITTGGCDSVFTRLKTKSEIALGVERAFSHFYGGASIVLSLECLDRGSYQFHYDEYGEKGNAHAYLTHDNPITFAAKQSALPTDSNEVMLNQTITPKHIKAIVVNSQYEKLALISKMEKEGLVSTHNGKKFFLEKALEDFIYTVAEVKYAAEITT